MMKSWVDVPQDIVGLISNKLQFRDHVNFRAVCRSWREFEYRSKCSDFLLWVTHYSWTRSESPGSYPFTSELMDPFSSRVYRVSNATSMNNKDDDNGTSITLYDSKYGWMLLGSQEHGLFLHNPFINDVILLPRLWSFCFVGATFTMDPKSPESEFLALYQLSPGAGQPYEIQISIYRPSKGNSWSTKHIEFTQGKYHSVYYKKENLYCLGLVKLKRYSLVDESWVTLASCIEYIHAGILYVNLARSWLIEKEESYLMIWHLPIATPKWFIFKLNLSGQRWIEVQIKGCAIFMSEKTARPTPLVNGNGEIIEDCRVFYQEADGDVYRLKCYSMKEMKEVESEAYEWMKTSSRKISFIEPPFAHS